MTDWNRLFQDDAFRAYRKRQAEAVAKIIGHNVTLASAGEAKSTEYIKGGLSVVKSLLRLPEELTNDEKVREQLSVQLQEDIGNITTYLVRDAVFRE